MSKKVTGKESGGRMRVVVGVVLLLFAIGFGLLILPQAFNSQQQTYNVYAITQDAYAGTTITADMVSLVTTTDVNVAKSACTEVDSVMNAVLTVDVYKGQYLLKTNIGIGSLPGGEEAPPVAYIDKVPAGKQLISLPVPSLSASVSYQIGEGDVIRFYSTYTDGERHGQAYTPVELQYVEVFGVYDSSGIECEISGGAPASLALIVTQIQAERIVELTDGRKTYFSLMSSGDDTRAEAFLQYQEKVLDELAKENTLLPDAVNGENGVVEGEEGANGTNDETNP